jgi:hypothetical protein
MKTKELLRKILSVFLLSLLLTSCSTDDTAATDASPDLNLEHSMDVAQTDQSVDVAFNIMNIAYAEIEEDEGRSVSLFSSCATITRSNQGGVTFVTLDFGLGCTLNNGAVVSGLIHFTYGPIQAGTVTITYSFENFVHNERAIEGEGSLFRVRNNAGGNPQYTANHELVITFPSGMVAEVDGTHEVEWVEGVGSGIWSDNVFSVTGNRAILLSTGFSHYAIITEALRKEASCWFVVSGMLDITRNGTEGVLDFGDGTCDNLAILTVNGVDHIIILN